MTLEAAKADRAFKSLLRQTNPVAQLYGLVGLYVTDRITFERTIASFLLRPDSVRMLFECSGARLPVGKLAREIKAGIWTAEFQSNRSRSLWALMGFPRRDPSPLQLSPSELVRVRDALESALQAQVREDGHQLGKRTVDAWDIVPWTRDGVRGRTAVGTGTRRVPYRCLATRDEVHRWADCEVEIIPQ